MAARLILALGVAAALAGCVGPRGGGGRDGAAYERAPEFVGRSMRVETAAGQVSILRFAPDGKVQATFGTRSTEGRWRMEGDDLCFTWAGDFRECWPHKAAFREGRTTTLTSSRGNVVKVTLL